MTMEYGLEQRTEMVTIDEEIKETCKCIYSRIQDVAQRNGLEKNVHVIGIKEYCGNCRGFNSSCEHYFNLSQYNINHHKELVVGYQPIA